MIDQTQITRLLNSSRLDLRPVVAVTLRACGLTYREIGEAFGITRSAVEQMVKKYDPEA